jgi:putative Holliday junction resolvase
MRILAIDPGEKRIGVAISDPTATIASPLTVLKHISRPVDAAAIAELANQQDARLIVIGKSLDEQGLPTPASRRADRLVNAIRQQCDLPITTWDESFSTQDARHVHIIMNVPRHKRGGHLDDLAATMILQSYLDWKGDH